MAQTAFFEVNQAIQELGGLDLNKCMQCGLCSSVCPWREVDSPFFVRKMIRQGQLGLEGYERDEILYACTTCNRCVINCPRDVKIIDIVRSMRSLVMGAGAVPESLRTMVGSCHSNGNPWSGPREKRVEWADGLDVPVFDRGTEYLLFVCCTACYDKRSRNISRSIVKLLKTAGVSFGIIGIEESCCGESLRKIGAEEEFRRLAEANIDLFNQRGVRKIITISPHCMYAFTKDYAELGADLEVIHATQLLNKLYLDGLLTLRTQNRKKITYHDPCYLGRHLKVFEEPRNLINALGSEFVELERSKTSSLCCGGGGGRLWMETKMEERFSILRVEEAHEKGAEIIATACPYCISMLEDALRTENMTDEMKVLDVVELVSQSVE